MIYLIRIISNEIENFVIEIEIDAEQTFLHLHEIIQNSCGYDPSQLTSFFLADEEWDKGIEVSRIEGSSSVTINTQQDKKEAIKLKEFIQNKNDKLIYNFDVFSDRNLFLELKSIVMEKSKNTGVITLSKGEAPNQLLDEKTGVLRPPVETGFGELDDMSEIYGSMDEIF
jgi:NDP-sugar pyrophosphorylase family protein